MSTVSEEASKISDIVSAVTAQHFADANTKPTLSNVSMMAAHAVELYTATEGSPLEGKLQAAKDLVPTIIERAVQMGVMTSAEGAKMQAQAIDGMDVIGEIIETVVKVANNPTVLAAAKELQVCCTDLKAKRAKKRARK